LDSILTAGHPRRFPLLFVLLLVTKRKSMKSEATLTTAQGTTKLVNAHTLLEVLFDERSRPSLRSLRTWTKSRIVPCVRCGGLVFYDIEQVRAALTKRTIRSG